MKSVWLLLALSTPIVLTPLAAEPEPERPGPQRALDVVLLWNETALDAVRTEKTPPPLAARNLAIVHAAIYDSVNIIDSTHRPYRLQGITAPGTVPEAAVAVAAHRVLVSLYPRQVEKLDAVLDTSLNNVPEGDAKTSGVLLGQAVAEKLLTWRAQDGATRRTAYTSSTAPGLWRPTPPGYKAALLPQWSSVTCFCMRSGDQFRPADPPALASIDYAASFREVKLLGGTQSTHRTPEQTVIARFWEDGEGTVTPPGHWNRIAQTVSTDRGLSLAENARLFALLNLALADAGIVSWDCKFKFNVWRPVDGIRLADANVNPDTTPDPDWTPLLPTPPFPAYTSGHSTFSAAAATVLAHYFGTDDVRFTTTCETLPGVTRTFSRFSDAAAEAGKSRIYGGIHWEFDNREGLATGRALGDYVGRNFLTPRPVMSEFRRLPGSP